MQLRTKTVWFIFESLCRKQFYHRNAKTSWRVWAEVVSHRSELSISRFLLNASRTNIILQYLSLTVWRACKHAQVVRTVGRRLSSHVTPLWTECCRCIWWLQETCLTSQCSTNVRRNILHLRCLLVGRMELDNLAPGFKVGATGWRTV